MIYTALVIVSGRIYQKNEDIFFQTYAKRVRLSKAYPPFPINDTASITVKAPGGEKLEFSAAIPGETITFPPRQLRMADLERVEKIFEEAAKVYARPDDERAAYTIELNPRNPAAFAVTSIRADGWMEIRSFFNDRKGWVNLKPEDAAIVHGYLPELDLINGLVGYLRLRQAFDGGRFEADPLPMINPMHQSFMRYSDRGPAVAGKEPVSIALSLSGTAFLLKGGESATQKSLKLFKNAVEKQPYNADLLNLKAIAEANLSFQQNEASSAVQMVRSDLLDALSLKPNNPLAIGNLEALYTYLSDKPQLLAAMPDKPTPNQLQSTRRRLQKMQNLLRK